MGTFEIAILFIVALAGFDLWVGVANDAVNFLNSAIGSKISRRKTIIGVAALGVLVGALFSQGLMEVARKGVFDPGVFYGADGTLNLTALLAIYLGVMAADIILLDLFNTFGLPTSTTVSIVSELTGASIAVAFWMHGADLLAGLSVINTGPLLGIYTGIFLSIFIAFFSGAVVMFLTRICFTFNLARTFPKVGWLWTSLAFGTLGYFVLFKGAQSVSFLSEETKAGLMSRPLLFVGPLLLASALLAILARNRHVLVFRVIILAATCALAMAFAGNDLVNFIGPTVAAAQAVFVEGIDLTQRVATPNWALVLSGIVMVISLATSRKARTVTDTEVRLAAQGEAEQRFRPNRLAKAIVNTAIRLKTLFSWLLPLSLKGWVDRRTGRHYEPENAPPYDLLRASVNLVVAAALISLGTANKLPLSTTYITFMVAMGAALADGTWNRKNGASRVTGILAVVGGWMLTGIIAASVAFVMASIFFLADLTLGMLIVSGVLLISLWRLNSTHSRIFSGKKTVFDDRKEGLAEGAEA